MLFVTSKRSPLDDVYWLLWMHWIETLRAADREDSARVHVPAQPGAEQDMLLSFPLRRIVRLGAAIPRENKGSGPLKNELVLLGGCESHVRADAVSCRRRPWLRSCGET